MSLISPKSILARLGIAVSKVTASERSLSASHSTSLGWLIEFVGPSGVGKTTLFKQVAPMLRQDWFFEHHAKGLLGKVAAEEATAQYIRQLLKERLETLQDADLTLERVAEISQRACEVARLGSVTKSQGLPRGFVMDDGLAHFFAEQIMQQDRDATAAFMARTAYVFVLPDAADPQTDVYLALRDVIQGLGRPVLTVHRSTAATNPSEVTAFIKNDVLAQTTP